MIRLGRKTLSAGLGRQTSDITHNCGQIYQINQGILFLSGQIVKEGPGSLLPKQPMMVWPSEPLLDFTFGAACSGVAFIHVASLSE